MLVRVAASEDARAIAEIQVAAWRAAYQGFMPAEYLASLDPQKNLAKLIAALGSPEPPFRMKVAESGGVILGCVMLGAPRYPARPGTLELWALNIHPDHWRRGVGRLLAQESLKDATAQGYARLELWCLVGNEPATALYESTGFVLTGESRTTSGLTGHPLHELAYATAA